MVMVMVMVMMMVMVMVMVMDGGHTTKIVSNELQLILNTERVRISCNRVPMGVHAMNIYNASWKDAYM